MASGVYFMLAARSNLVKIGWSARPAFRVTELQTGSPEPLKILRVVPGGKQLEKHLHAKFAAMRQHGEWFTFEGDLRSVVEGADPISLPPTLPPPRRKCLLPRPVAPPRLWQHKNGVWYVLYGRRWKHRVSTRSKDESEAQEFLHGFMSSP